MLEHLPTLREWQSAGRRACLATLIGVDGSAPRDPGASMAIGADGELRGSITGGCIEAALVEQAQAVFRTGTPRVARFGISEQGAHAIGLSCGGTVELFIDEPRADDVRAISQALSAGTPVGLAVRLDGTHAGARLAVFSAALAGSLGDAELDASVAAELRTQGAGRQTSVRAFGEQGEPHGEVRIFLHRALAKARMYLFGAVDFAAAMLHVGKLLGYEVILCDARAAFATPARFPDADRIEVAWPDDLLAREALDARSAVIAMTHDEKFDVPLLRAALATPACYIAVMGSRHTNERRLAQLREAGVSEAQLARLSAPAGLDTGARSPEEVAVSIGAELIAVQNGRTGGRLKDARGPLRGPAHAAR